MVRRLFLIGIGLALALLCSELGTRIFPLQSALTNEWLLNARDKYISTQYIFEKSGLPTSMATDSARIAVLGDSYSERDLWRHLGISSYPEVLAAALSGHQRSARIYNFAIGAVGPDQELRYFIDRVLPLKPTVVVWQFYANDVWDNVIQPVYAIDTEGQLTPLDASNNWMYRRQVFYDWLPGKPILLHSYLVRKLLYLFEAMKYQDLPRSYEKHPENWGLAKMRLEVETMNRLARNYGFNVIYVLIPPQALYLGTSDQGNIDVVHALTFDHDIDQLLSREPHYVRIRFDLPSGESLAPLPSEQILKDIYLHGEDNMGLGDRHITQQGQRVVAQQIYDELQTLLPIDR